MIEKLEKAITRNEISDLLKPLNKTELLKLAKELKLYPPSNIKKANLVEMIVDSTVGLKLRAKAYAGVDLSYKLRQ